MNHGMNELGTLMGLQKIILRIIYIYILLNNMIMNNIVNIKFVIKKSKYYSKNIIKSLLTMNKY